MKFPQKSLFIVVAICLSLTFACDESSDDDGGPNPPVDDCSTISRSYSQDIVPILNQTCAIPNCHVDGFINGDFEFFADFKALADSGRLQNQIESGAMPPSNTAGPTELTENELATIICWIEDGALEN